MYWLFVMSLLKSKDFCHLGFFFFLLRIEINPIFLRSQHAFFSLFFFLRCQLVMQSFISALTFEFVQNIFNQTHSPQFIPTASEKTTCHSDGWVPFGKKSATAWASCWSKTHVSLASFSPSVKFLLDSHCDESDNSNRKTSSRRKSCLWPVTGRSGNEWRFPEQCS